jgi:thiamine-monophosphate kinase
MRAYIYACDMYGGRNLVGGDTDLITKGLCIISVTAIGEADDDKIVYRNGAKKGRSDNVLTGRSGWGIPRTTDWKREKRLFLENPEIQPELVLISKHSVRRQLKPVARKKIIEYFEEIGLKPTAMMDLSDGLSSDILQICRQSGVGCETEEVSRT